MKVWRAYILHPHDGTLYVWGTSRASTALLAKNEFAGSKPKFEQLDIPTKKADLVDWLNRNFSTDNG